ncbi:MULTISPECIES: hypothetical protein [unclassified Streptomyces]|uniref:hypothetical protein n=1 Tax=unclassified Streptomyces TaxID=2593676 RepID=UPI003807AECB
MVLFNSLYIDAAVKQLAADGFRVTDALLARLSPLQYSASTSSAATPSPGRPRRACGSCATQTPLTRMMANSLGAKAVRLGHLL